MHTIDTLLQAAKALLHAGERADARRLLVQALRLDPRHEVATLWLSATTDDPHEQRQILARVLELNPANVAAQQGLALLGEPEPPAPAPPPWSPPEPVEPQVLGGLPVECAACGAQGYAKAVFCFRCHTPLRSCKTCIAVAEPECKALQHITDPEARNICPWWRPKA